MASNIKFKRSAVQNRVPTTAQLELGELALNTYDGKLYTEKNSGSAAVVEIGSILSSLVVDGDNGGGNGDVVFHGATAGRDITWDASAKELLILDGVKTIYGDGGDLSIYHSVTTSKNIYQGDSHQFWNKAGNENLATLTADGACDLYYDSNKKLETTLTGAKTTGVSSCTSHCMPTADVGGDLGSTTNRWANVYTADMQMSNEGSQNDIDGTWGKYTIQEGESDLFLINRRTGKKYKFMLEEVQ